MNGASENQELHALYQFGQPESTDNRSTVEREPTSTIGNRGGDSTYDNGQQEAYSPQENFSNAMPTSPAAFGTANDTYVATGNGNMGSYATTSFDAAEGKQHHKEGSKKNVIKMVLGKDKKSTKGMTDDEKKAVKLQERWKNALLEEQRLNELETRVVQEEAATNTLGVAPNFPPKLLCIKPLVYHKISAVPSERRLFVKMAFGDWIAVCIILIANCPITIACHYAPAKKGYYIVRDINKGLNIVLACVYLVGIPLSFLIWYWPIYQSNYKQRPALHVLALSGLLVALAQAIFALVGPPSYGFCGIMSSEWIAKSREPGVVAPMAIVTALWGLQAVFTCYMIYKVFVYYRHDLAARRALHRQQNLASV